MNFNSIPPSFISNYLDKDKIQEIENDYKNIYNSIYAPPHIKLFRFISNFFGVNPQDLKSKSRKTELVRARQLFCYFAKKENKLSYSEIGQEIDRNPFNKNGRN